MIALIGGPLTSKLTKLNSVHTTLVRGPSQKLQFNRGILLVHFWTHFGELLQHASA